MLWLDPFFQKGTYVARKRKSSSVTNKKKKILTFEMKKHDQDITLKLSLKLLRRISSKLSNISKAMVFAKNKQEARQQGNAAVTAA